MSLQLFCKKDRVSRLLIRSFSRSLLTGCRARMIFFLLLVFSLSASGTVFAQAPEQEYSILGISVEGNVSGSAETIIAQSTLRKGDKITIPSDAIRRAILRLWQQGIFSDVNIEATKVIPQEGGTYG